MFNNQRGLEQISTGMAEIYQAMATLETTTANASIAEETAAAGEINSQSNDIDMSILELESVIRGK